VKVLALDITQATLNGFEDSGGISIISVFMDQVDRAIARLDSTVMVYDMSEPSSVGDYSRRGSANSFNFNWRSPLGLLQKKKKEPARFSVMTREAQMESVIFDFTDEDDLRRSFTNLQLKFLEDIDTFQTAVLGEEFNGLESGEFHDAVFDNGVAIHGNFWSRRRLSDREKASYGGKVKRFGKRGSSIDVTDVMPIASHTEAPPVQRQPRRRSLNPVSWWRY